MISVKPKDGVAWGVAVGGRRVAVRVGVNLAGVVAVPAGNWVEVLVGAGTCPTCPQADRRTPHRKKISNNLKLKTGIYILNRFYQARS
jgi:hypothetical protein